MLLQALGILGVIFLGLIVVNILMPESNILEKIFLGNLLGWGLFTLALFLLNEIGVAFSLKESSLILISLLVFFLVINLIVNRVRERKTFILLLQWRIGNWTLVEKAFLTIAVFLFLSAFLYDIYWPVGDWDTLVLYDFRAKTFIASGFMAEGISRGYFFGYPLLTSLSHTWLYLLGFKNPMFIYALFFLSFVGASYSLVGRWTNRYLSLFFSLGIMFSHGIYGHAQIGYTNLPYTIYYLLSVIFLFYWTKTKKIGHLAISALLLGLSTWARSADPFWLAVILVLMIFCLIYRKLESFFLFLLIFVPIQYSWLLFEQQHLGAARGLVGTAPSLVDTLLNNLQIERIFEVMSYVLANVVRPFTLLFSIFLALIPILIGLVKKHREQYVGQIMLAFIILFNLALIFLGTYIFSIDFESWRQIGGSAERMSIILGPLLLLYIIAVMGFESK